MTEETEEHGGFFLWVGGGGWDARIPICVCLVGPLDLMQDYVTPMETLSPGTQPTNRIRVSGFETGKHQGGQEKRAAAQGPGAGGREPCQTMAELAGNDQCHSGKMEKHRHSSWVGGTLHT